MTPTEFKAWFDGFTEALNGTPTEAQWARIKARVAEIDGKPVTERVYIDRYWPSYPQFWGYQNRYDTHRVWMSAGNNTAAPTSRMTGCATDPISSHSFDSIEAMYASGKADAVMLARS